MLTSVLPSKSALPSLFGGCDLAEKAKVLPWRTQAPALPPGRIPMEPTERAAAPLGQGGPGQSGAGPIFLPTGVGHSPKGLRAIGRRGLDGDLRELPAQ